MMHTSLACPDKCPGCSHRHLSANESRQQKQQWLTRKLAGWADCISPIQAVPAGQELGYRDKVCLSTSWREDRWQIGLLHQDELIPIPDCPVHSSRVRAAMACIAHALPPAAAFPMVYYAQSGAQITLVLKSREMPTMKWLTPDLIENLSHIGIQGLWLHRHPSAGRRVFAKNGWDLVWGKARSSDNEGFTYGPTAFQQLISGLFARAMETVEAFFALTREDLVFDLYSGIGASLSRWSEKSSRVVGVELSGESVACANINAKGAVVYRGTCGHRRPQLTEALKKAHNRRLLFANPPRTGLEPETREWIASICRPENLAYLSCSTGTLKRDLTELENQGYRIDQIIPYDFFPRTHHVETLVLFRRKNPA